MLDDTLSVAARAAAAGLARGTLSCWKSRGYLPDSGTGFDEAVAAAVMRHLTALGVSAGEASDLLAAVRHRWRPDMLGKSTPAVLIATKRKGCWTAEVRAALQLPSPPPAGAVIIDLGAVAASVIARLAKGGA